MNTSKESTTKKSGRFEWKSTSKDEEIEKILLEKKLIEKMEPKKEK